MSHTRWTRAAVLVCALAPAAALAQQPPITLDRYRAAATPEDDFHVERASDFGHLRAGAQLSIDYGYAPLVYEGTRGDASTEVSPIVEHHLVGSLGLSFGLFDRLVLYGALPVTLLSEGAAPSALEGSRVAPADGPGLGNATLGARARIIGERDEPFALALAASFALPTAGDEQRYRGEQAASFAPRLIGELRPGLGARIVLDVGARIHEEASMPTSNLRVQHALTWGLGFTIPVFTDADPRTHLDAHAQLFGATAFDDALGRESTTLEALLGLKLHHASGVIGGLAGGAGLARGVGTPDARLVASLGYVIPEAFPAPTPSTDVVPFRSPAPAPVIVEAAPVIVEAAPAPALDADDDGVLDAGDSCPRVAGAAEHHGCTAPPQAVLTPDRVEIRDVVHFEAGHATLLERSHPLLRSVAQVLNEHLEVGRVIVEGHTDARGERAHNLALSTARAQSVVRFLIEEGGVSAQRLEAQGLGPDRPLVERAHTAADHARNRRVEFRVAQR